MIKSEMGPTVVSNPGTNHVADEYGPGSDIGGASPPASHPPTTSSDHVQVAAAPADIEVRDHTNPANWSKEEWMAAIKRDPERYGKLFMEMSAAGQLPEGMDDSKMQLFVQSTMQDFNRHISLLSEMQQAIHETRKSIHIQV